MITYNVKLLLKKLNRHTLSQFDSAAGFAMTMGHYEIGLEHLLIKMLDEGRGDIPVLLKKNNVPQQDLKSALMRSLGHYDTGNTGRPSFSPGLISLIEQAWIVSSVEFSEDMIRSGHIMIALLAPPGRQAFPWLEEAWPLLGNEKVATVLASGLEDSVEEVSRSEGSDETPTPEGMEAIQRFTENLTEKAKKGEIDPVFARDNEIRQMIDILTRRRKNNPILVGDPGVGKTAIVEGLALRAIEGDVPSSFIDVDILTLDMGLLQAGASVKGEFENRLKTVIKAVKAYPKPVITFIDEAHTLIGAGGGAGGGDAANLLKPALARGELRTIAATTWNEYKKYFEKDPALARRFQIVKVEEPDDEGVFAILRGLKGRYESHHGIHITDAGLSAAARLSRRYIIGRKLPDKAIDLLDTAAARVGLSQHVVPPEITDFSQAMLALEREKETIVLDFPTSSNPDSITARIAEIDATMADLSEREKIILEKWDQEKVLTGVYMKAISEFKKNRQEFSGADYSEREARLRQSVKALRAHQAGRPMAHPELDETIVESVVSDWTGIPVGNIAGNESDKLLRMREEIGVRIIGQNQAIGSIAESLRVARSGLKDPRKPMGVFMLIGPSGVGKTETALALADSLFGGEQGIISLNMSEYQEKHNVSRLIGSPPGYVGYGEGGVLTEAARQKPYSVILLDEVEKAHPDVMELFYQVFDKGILADGEGRVVDFSNTVIFLTSNLGGGLIGEIVAAGPDDAMPLVEDVLNAIRPALLSHFAPAFLARMTLLPYYPLSRDVIVKIVRLKLGMVEQRLAAHGAELLYTADVIDWIASRCQVAENGARNVEHVINSQLLPQVSLEILSTLGEKHAFKGKIMSLAIREGEVVIKMGGAANSLEMDDSSKESPMETFS